MWRIASVSHGLIEATGEPSLVEHFGSDYARYKDNVPAWIPRLRPCAGDVNDN